MGRAGHAAPRHPPQCRWTPACKKLQLENPPFFGATEAEQRSNSSWFADHIVNVFCVIDVVPLDFPHDVTVQLTVGNVQNEGNEDQQ